VSFQILRALSRACANPTPDPAAKKEDYLVIAAQDVINRLLDEDAEHLSDLTQRLGKSVHLQSEDCAPEHWELIQRPAQT